jgi:DNA recombination protein RmuC
MNAISLLVTLLVGVALGAALGYLLARGKLATITADLTGRARAADERAAAAHRQAEIVERAAQEKAELIDGQLAERFQSMSAQALDQSARTFLQIAEGRLSAANAKAAGELDTRKAAVEHLVQPLRETLARVEAQLREADAARRSSHAALAEQVSVARQSSDQLRVQTQAPARGSGPVG